MEKDQSSLSLFSLASPPFCPTGEPFLDRIQGVSPSRPGLCLDQDVLPDNHNNEATPADWQNAAQQSNCNLDVRVGTRLGCAHVKFPLALVSAGFRSEWLDPPAPWR